MRGELDWIVMKALEKDRNRRYETANGLAPDMQRYLADEPVQACPPSAWYRFRKFARRNKTGLTAAGTGPGRVGPWNRHKHRGKRSGLPGPSMPMPNSCRLDTPARKRRTADAHQPRAD